MPERWKEIDPVRETSLRARNGGACPLSQQMPNRSGGVSQTVVPRRRRGTLSTLYTDSLTKRIMLVSSLIPSQFWRGFVLLTYLGVCVEIGLQGYYYVTTGDFLFRRVALPIYTGEPNAGFGNRLGLSFDHRTNEFHAHYYINQAGFRVPRPNVEYTLAKPANTYRVMILGPSFAFGWGADYELSFAGVLQQLLQESAFTGEKKLEIIDAGVPAMPLVPQLVWFERVGKHYEPDLVLQVVYGSMAIKSSSEPRFAVDDKGYLVPVNADASWRWRETFKKVATVFYGWLLWTKLNEAYFPHPGDSSGVVLGAGREMAASRNFDPTNSEVREAMHVYSNLSGIVRAAGAQLLVVYVPLSYAIHREDESRWRHLGIRDIPRQMAFDAAFVLYLNEHQIPSIDITQQLKQSAAVGQRMYYWLDIHWTPAGNAAAARAVAEYLIGR
jgi:SGNH hydrolase-like domain, acetyltransferase AlgX